jgi:hypothetical protein
MLNLFEIGSWKLCVSEFWAAVFKGAAWRYPWRGMVSM